MIKKEDLLFKIFWKTKDEFIKNEDNTCSLQVVLSPRFGRIGAVIWFCLVSSLEWIVENQNGNT